MCLAITKEERDRFHTERAMRVQINCSHVEGAIGQSIVGRRDSTDSRIENLDDGSKSLAAGRAVAVVAFLRDMSKHVRGSDGWCAHWSGRQIGQWLLRRSNEEGWKKKETHLVAARALMSFRNGTSMTATETSRSVSH